MKYKVVYDYIMYILRVYYNLAWHQELNFVCVI